MNIVKDTLGDWKHWIGWIITTIAIIGVFHYLGVHGLHTPFYHPLILLIVIVIIDFIKHIIKLQ
ncbi:MAG: hypothetical protein KKF56_05395 [Nanoarchaeota archaeon]|nr:hypothetical protein [Nanoarchaeota archaeon]